MVVRLSIRLEREERVPADVVCPGVRLASGSAERIDRSADLDTVKPCRFEKLFPACARQATGNSTSPKVDVALRLDRDRTSISDVGELQDTAGSQDTPGLR